METPELQDGIISIISLIVGLIFGRIKKGQK